MVERSVQLEIAQDVIYAAVPCRVTSFSHDVLSPVQAAGFIDNRPASLFCAHPVATLLGKLDAICNQHRKAIDPSRYVRHFEDAHHIITKLEHAHAALGIWHWGPRVPLLDACATIRDWLARSNLFAPESE